MHIVVLHDPSGKHAEGEILTANVAEVAKSKHVVTIPIIPQLLRDNAFAGYAKRAYGRGWTFDAQKAGRGCPLALHVDAEYPTLHWAARELHGVLCPPLGERAQLVDVAKHVGQRHLGLDYLGIAAAVGTLDLPTTAVQVADHVADSVVDVGRAGRARGLDDRRQSNRVDSGRDVYRASALRHGSERARALVCG